MNLGNFAPEVYFCSGYLSKCNWEKGTKVLFVTFFMVKNILYIVGSKNERGPLRKNSR